MLFSLKHPLGRVYQKLFFLLFFLWIWRDNKVSRFLIHIPLSQSVLSHISSPSQMNVIKKLRVCSADSIVPVSFYTFQQLAPGAHFFSCFDLKMQWKYLAFRWHSAGEVWWISASSENWISLTAPGPVSWLDRQSDRARDNRRAGGGISSLPPLLQIAWHNLRESRGCWECQYAAQTAVLLWYLWLANQTISSLIMISQVII